MSSVRELLPNRTNAELTQLVTSSHFIDCVDKFKSTRARQRAPVPATVIPSSDGSIAAVGGVPAVTGSRAQAKPMIQGTKRSAATAFSLSLTPTEFRQRVCTRMDHEMLLGKTKLPSAKWVARRLETTAQKLDRIADYDARVARRQLKAAHWHANSLQKERKRAKEKDDDDEIDADAEETD